MTQIDRTARGAAIKSQRTAAGLTQQQLADKVGVSRISVINWEKGKTDIDALNGFRLSRALGLPVNSLLGEDELRRLTVKPHFHYLHSESPKAERIYPHHGTTVKDLMHFMHEDPTWSVDFDRDFNLYLHREKPQAAA